jgi:hypothetical protein
MKKFYNSSKSKPNNDFHFPVLTKKTKPVPSSVPVPDYKNKLLINHPQPQEPTVKILIKEEKEDNIEYNYLSQENIDKANNFYEMQKQYEILRFGEDEYYTMHPPYVNMFDKYEQDSESEPEPEQNEDDDFDSEYDL